MMHRRRFLTQTWNGIGALGLAGMLAEESSQASKATANPLTPQQPHLPGQAKHCIFLFMQGGVSQMDAFEHKPMLQQWHGKPIPGSPSVRGELQGRLSFPHVCVGSRFHFSSMATVVAGFPNSSHTWQARATGWPSSMASRQTIRITAPPPIMSPLEANSPAVHRSDRGFNTGWEP